MQVPHDEYDESDPRITPNNWRSPRVVVIDWTHDGQLSFGELSNDGVVEETTLTGRVLDVAEAYARRGDHCMCFSVDGIKYVCVIGSKP